MLIDGDPVPSARVWSRPGSERAFDAYLVVLRPHDDFRLLTCGHQGTTEGICRDVLLAIAAQDASSPIEAARGIGLRFNDPRAPGSVAPAP